MPIINLLFSEGTLSQKHGAIMEHPEYQDCLDLMSFDEIYCSPETGFIEGDIGGYIVIGCCVAITAIVAAIVRNARE